VATIDELHFFGEMALEDVSADFVPCHLEYTSSLLSKIA
jgi:hypothetical protein